MTPLEIQNIRDRVLAGGEVSFEEAKQFLDIDNPAEMETLLEAAHQITLQFHSTEPSLCSLVNAKSYLCGEDCSFCAQSVRFDTRVDRYKLMSPEEVVAVAKQHEERGSKNFCVVTSGGELTDPEFDQMLVTIQKLRQETKLNIDASLGFLNKERAQRLKEAGLRRFNSNLQTSPDYYSKIVSTHSYDTRIETLDMIEESGLEVCSGGILGMGESREDRVKLAFELKPYHPECLPINILNPRPGTPLENQPIMKADEALKTIAMFRFVHPGSSLKLAGGRETCLTEQDQERALKGGANGFIFGGYLTTDGNPVKRDFELLKRAGYTPPKAMGKTEFSEPGRIGKTSG